MFGLYLWHGVLWNKVIQYIHTIPSHINLYTYKIWYSRLIWMYTFYFFMGRTCVIKWSSHNAMRGMWQLKISMVLHDLISEYSASSIIHILLHKYFLIVPRVDIPKRKSTYCCSWSFNYIICIYDKYLIIFSMCKYTLKVTISARILSLIFVPYLKLSHNLHRTFLKKQVVIPPHRLFQKPFL